MDLFSKPQLFLNKIDIIKELFDIWIAIYAVIHSLPFKIFSERYKMKFIPVEKDHHDDEDIPYSRESSVDNIFESE